MGWSRRFKLAVSLSVLLLITSFGSDYAFANGKTLIPMGHSIGIKMQLKGVFVSNEVMISKGNWLKAGDQINQVNDFVIHVISDFEQAVSKIDEELQITLTVVRSDETFQIQADAHELKRLLPFLKDRTEGTGTLTYVDLTKGSYGALGHQIIDSALKSPPSFREGAIYLSEIDQIKKSVPGIPGYKISTIIEDEDFLGSIQTNSIYGIFGTWNRTSKEVLTKPMEIMQQSELKKGIAEIYTTVKGTEVESFSIQITEIEKDQFHFILTDRKLIEKTGGILQGMSGSPVIQNGKFVGAVTHMFVDTPEKGAALFLEKMRISEN